MVRDPSPSLLVALTRDGSERSRVEVSAPQGGERLFERVSLSVRAIDFTNLRQ